MHVCVLRPLQQTKMLILQSLSLSYWYFLRILEGTTVLEGTCSFWESKYLDDIIARFSHLYRWRSPCYTMLCRASGCSIRSITCPCVSWSLCLMSMWKKGGVTAPKRNISRKRHFVTQRSNRFDLISEQPNSRTKLQKSERQNNYRPKITTFERRYTF